MARTTGSGNRAGGSASGSPSSYVGGGNAVQKIEAALVMKKRQGIHNLQTLQDQYADQKYKVSSLYDKRNSVHYKLMSKSDPEFKKLSADITREEKKLKELNRKLLIADDELRVKFHDSWRNVSHRSKTSNVFL